MKIPWVSSLLHLQLTAVSFCSTWSEVRLFLHRGSEHCSCEQHLSGTNIHVESEITVYCDHVFSQNSRLQHQLGPNLTERVLPGSTCGPVFEAPSPTRAHWFCWYWAQVIALCQSRNTLWVWTDVNWCTEAVIPVIFIYFNGLKSVAQLVGPQKM